MPEIWLNYGANEVVLDIKAENLEQKIDAEGKTLSDSEIESKLESLDISKPTELVILNTSESIKKTPISLVVTVWSTDGIVETFAPKMGNFPPTVSTSVPFKHVPLQSPSTDKSSSQSLATDLNH